MNSFYRHHCNAAISPVLAKIFNMCIKDGFFPDSLKIAKVTPVYKKGARDEIVNYYIRKNF